MSVEQIYEDGLAARATLHAALGEPGRLAMVDALLFGEASPSELQQRLGMASNLLAHHLRVLEEAGVVARHRSEGDRRRSYVTLVADALHTLTPAGPPLPDPVRVVFVCTHNSARSQLAAALWTDASAVPATSAGTHPARQVHPGAVAVAGRRQLSLAPVVPRHIGEVLDAGDLVVTVCDSAHEELAGTGGAPTRVGLHWSIPDPVRVGVPAAFDRVVDELTDRVARLTPVLHAPTPASSVAQGNRRTS